MLHDSNSSDGSSTYLQFFWLGNLQGTTVIEEPAGAGSASSGVLFLLLVSASVVFWGTVQADKTNKPTKPAK
jgi:hypothetical protein